ncbi:MAG TPA: DUF5946 family protein [Thermoleophilaceae bacterium]
MNRPQLKHPPVGRPKDQARACYPDPSPSEERLPPGPTTSECPGCRLVLPQHDGPRHPYIGASAACWALYGHLLARAYSDPEIIPILQLIVDTYAVQHPGTPERRAAQSVGIHLMTLCMVLEQGADPRDGPQLHKRMVTRPAFSWLDPPPNRGSVTVGELVAVTDAGELDRRVWDWGREVWDAWALHHPTVRGWLRTSVGSG